MRKILLLRHAAVDAPGEPHRCLGSRTDPPILPIPDADREALAALLRRENVRAVWSSPLLRCRQTAAAIAGELPVGVAPGLRERDCGTWDGLSFDEIRSRFPEEYARRGADPALPPPGGEPPDMAAARALEALRYLAGRTEGSFAAVAHAGVNRALLCALLGRPFAEMRALPQPYLCVNVLLFDGKAFSAAAVGLPPGAPEGLPQGGYHEKAL